jgi:hypothetical protein
VTTIQPEQMIAALLVTAAIFSYFNERFLGISATIGMLLISLFVARSDCRPTRLDDSPLDASLLKISFGKLPNCLSNNFGEK